MSKDEEHKLQHSEEDTADADARLVIVECHYRTDNVYEYESERANARKSSRTAAEPPKHTARNDKAYNRQRDYVGIIAQIHEIMQKHAGEDSENSADENLPKLAVYEIIKANEEDNKMSYIGKSDKKHPPAAARF